LWVEDVPKVTVDSGAGEPDILVMGKPDVWILDKMACSDVLEGKMDEIEVLDNGSSVLWGSAEVPEVLWVDEIGLIVLEAGILENAIELVMLLDKIVFS
jgi:hypothetical protein